MGWVGLWPLYPPRLTTPCPFSLREFQSATHMTKVADLSPLPLVPLLVSAHGEDGGTNFTPSFASLQCLALLSISCHSAYCHVSGSKADTTQAFKPAQGLEMVVCGWTCAADTRPQGELGNCLPDYSAPGLLHWDWLSTSSGVFMGKRKCIPLMTRSIVWNAALMLPADVL